MWIKPAASIQHRLGGEPSSRCDIQHSLPHAHPGGAQKKWNKMAGDRAIASL